MLRFNNSAEQWSRDVEETNWTGNESDATRETSLYLSFALVCLPDGSSDSPGPSGTYELEPSEDEQDGESGDGGYYQGYYSRYY